MICSLCAKTRETKNDRLPKGWKRSAESIYCDACWRDRMMLRAVALPVVEIMDGTWEEFRQAVREMWAATTQCANWMMTELYTRDVRRESGAAKLPPMARVYLYPEARQRFPVLPSQSIAALEQATQGKYRAKRYDVIWTSAASLPTYRYPTPFSSPNQGWSVEIDNERPQVSVRLGDRRWKLRLRGGSRYRRQLAAINQIAAGHAERGSLDLYQQSIDGKNQVMCKMVAWLPRPVAQSGERKGVLYVRSTGDSLLVALNEKDEKLWTYNADQALRWSAEHRHQLQRWSEDQKFEQRPVPSFADRRAEAAEKYRQRMNSAIREIAASLAGYASRRKFAAVCYDDADTSFCAGFPWFALRDRVRVKLDELGIEFKQLIASANVAAETQPPLAGKDD